MQYKPYSAYKKVDSTWLEEIPLGWEVKRTKFMTEFQAGNGFPNDLQGNESGDFPFLKVSDISFKGKDVQKSNNYVTKGAISENNWK